MVNKVRPDADMRVSYGDDGRDFPHYYVVYKCSKCGKRIWEGDLACDECGTFFDWSQRAHVKETHNIVWS